MFTGIVSNIGTLVTRDGARLGIACGFEPASLELGGSIACDGCCLTVVRIDRSDAGAMFEVEASNETLARTTLGEWKLGRRINLERPLSLGSELGGHLVTGHIDGVARITKLEPDGHSIRALLDAPAEFARFIAGKGSVALDGVSLTVNEVNGKSFGVNLIAYTLAHTAWRDRMVGDLVNLEVDLLARYVERIASREADRP